MVIMVIVDRFSKAAQFVALVTYPAAQQTADLILKEVPSTPALLVYFPP